jgi:hypothetical protein
VVAGDLDDDDDDSDFDESVEEVDFSEELLDELGFSEDEELDESLEPELSELDDELELDEPLAVLFEASRLSLR